MLPEGPAPAIPAPAHSIDTVVQRLEDIIRHCSRTNNRAGYFAVLYYGVTNTVRDGIRKGVFEDNERMERLDVLFAGRYLQAWDLWISGGHPTESWNTAFTACIQEPTIILQHLLLGINAHINLDLGIAAVECMKGQPLENIHKDFDNINAVLASLVDGVETKVAKASPLLFLLQLHQTNWDEMLVQFSINTARQGAWDYAVALSGKSGDDYDQCIRERDAVIAGLAGSIAHPCNWLGRTVKLISGFEQKNVSDVIRILQGN